MIKGVHGHRSFKEFLL